MREGEGGGVFLDGSVFRQPHFSNAAVSDVSSSNDDCASALASPSALALPSTLASPPAFPRQPLSCLNSPAEPGTVYPFAAVSITESAGRVFRKSLVVEEGHLPPRPKALSEGGLGGEVSLAALSQSTGGK